jgi:DNA-binding MarR family transcriptional regulator
MPGDREEGLDADETSLVNVSESRVRILQALHGERRTASELARELGLDKSTVHGYLQDLHEEELVHRHENEERLWVYYTLTEAGEAIVDDERLTVLLNLASGIALLGAAALGIYRFWFLAGTGPQETSAPIGPEVPWLVVGFVALIVLGVAGLGVSAWVRRRRSSSSSTLSELTQSL